MSTFDRRIAILVALMVIVVLAVGCTEVKYELTAEVDPEGAGEVSGDGTYTDGTEAEIVAIADDGYLFSHWEDDDDKIGTDQDLQVKVEGDMTVTAVFLPEYVLQVEMSDEKAGQIEGGGTYAEGETAVVTARPDEGFQFDRWEKNGQEAARSRRYSLQLEEDVTLTAVFTEINHRIRVKASHEERGEVSGAGEYREGEEVVLRAKPGEGYEFRHWSKGGTFRGRERELNVVVRDDVEYTAHFGKKQPDPPEPLMPTEFFLDLHHHMATPDENIFFSPVSIYLALSQLYEGADGETREEIGALLGAGDVENEDFRAACAAMRAYLQTDADSIVLSIADSLWLNEGVKLHNSYAELLQEYHGTRISEIDFNDPKAGEKVNQWVADSTENMIEEIIDGAVPAEVFLLVNAIYFQGGWLEEFDPEETEQEEFTRDDGSTVTVPMMYRESEDGEYSYLDGDGFEAVRIPYGEEPGDARGSGDTRMAMYIFVPDDGLATFYDRLEPDSWEEWMDRLGSGFGIGDGVLGLPRFEIEYSEEDLREVLAPLGVESAFDGASADFGKMAPEGEGFFLDKIAHKAVIEVNEKGTEAAAVTYAIAIGDGPEPFEVVADRPFFFVIRDDAAETVLFAGAYVDPDQE